MAIQQISPGQIRSVQGNDNMGTDLVNLISKTLSYHKPVATPNDLPMANNKDGDSRLVLSDNRFWVWDEPTLSWARDNDVSTEARTKEIVIEYNNMALFNTTLVVGKPGGVANIETIILIVNGMIQQKGSDYTLGVTGQDPPCLIIEWISTDFNLESTDKLKVNYDMLIVN